MSWLAGWRYRIPFTIVHDDIDAPLDWFPVRLHLSAAAGIPIDIGDAATDRTLILTTATIINKGNPANADGIITSVEIYAVSGNDLADCEVGTFYTTNGNTLKCRDTEAIGAVTSGSKQTFSGLSLTVKVGDYIGIYFSSGQIEADGSGYDGVWFKTGDHCTVGDESDYTLLAGDAISVYGAGVCDVSCVFDEVGANSKKIALTKSDGTTELYGEIEKWDSVNEEAELWVSRDGWTISDTADTVGYLYYDNTHADNDAYIGIKNSTPAQSVWDANFHLVYHMDDGANTSGVYDSTSNNDDGTKKGAAEPVVTTSGQIANAQDFDGSDDYIESTNNGISGADVRTISCWVNCDAAGNKKFYASGSAATNGRRFNLSIEDITGTKYVLFRHYGGNIRFPGATTGSLIRVTARVPSGASMTDDVEVLVNGVEKVGTRNGGSDRTLDTEATHLFLGSNTAGAENFDGVIDEVRVSDTDRTDAWEAASYESERDHLITWGSEKYAPGRLVYGGLVNSGLVGGKLIG